MSKKIDAIANNVPSRMLLTALTSYRNKTEAAPSSKNRYVEVEFRIDGVEYDFEALISDWYKRLEEHFDSQLNARAQRLVTEAGLEGVATALRDAEDLVRKAL